MALKADFNAMLREYGPDSVFINEFKKLSYYYENVDKDNGWVPGANYVLTYEAGENSRFEMGGLPNTSDINGASYLKATIANPATVVGSIKIHEKDLEKHGDLKKSFLDFWPKNSKRFMKRFEERMSILLMGDGSICKATADGTVAGVLKLDRPHLLTIGEKIEIDDNNSVPVQGYVRSININTKEITVGTTPDGAFVAVDLTGYAVAQATKVYICGTGATGERFNSLREFILPAALGGSDTIHGLTKTASPILQSLITQADTATTAKALLKSLYNHYYETEMLGRSEKNEVLLSYKNFQWIALYLDGRRDFSRSDVTAGVGFKSMTLTGPSGDMKITALRDLQDDWAPVVDFNAVRLAGQKLFKMKHKQNGDLFHTERVAGVGGGYQHIIDIVTEAQHVCVEPGKLSALYSIPTITALE